MYIKFTVIMRLMSTFFYRHPTEAKKIRVSGERISEWSTCLLGQIAGNYLEDGDYNSDMFKVHLEATRDTLIDDLSAVQRMIKS
jgi:hypothetical protein